MLSFFEWLGQQAGRQDACGAFARFAVRDRIFPRQARRLNLFLQRYEHMPEQRAGVKLAHREWRELRAEASRRERFERGSK